jgi:hypothetical protein
VGVVCDVRDVRIKRRFISSMASSVGLDAGLAVMDRAGLAASRSTLFPRLYTRGRGLSSATEKRGPVDGKYSPDDLGVEGKGIAAASSRLFVIPRRCSSSPNAGLPSRLRPLLLFICTPPRLPNERSGTDGVR